MQIEIEQPQLSNLLNTVKRSIAAKNAPHPILQCVRIHAEDGNVECSGYNLELGIVAKDTCHVTENGTIAVPFTILNNLVNTLSPDDSIILHKQSPHVDDLYVQALPSRYHLRTADASDWPILNPGEATQTFQVNHPDFCETVKSAIYAASNEPSKQVLNGVRLSIANGSVFAAASDGHRLALTGQDDPDATQVVIPANSLREMIRMKGFDALLTITPSHVSYTVGYTTLTSRILTGNFPKLDTLVPATFASNIIVDRQELIGAISRIGILANLSFRSIKLSNANALGNLEVSTSADFGAGEEAPQCHGSTGESFNLSCNPDYLMDALRAIPSDLITIHANKSQEPFTVVPHNAASLQTHLIMPVQTRE